MSTRDDLIDLAEQVLVDHYEGSALDRSVLAGIVDALHDRLVGRLIEKWTWCVTCERPVNVHRLYRTDGHSIPGDKFAICDGPLEPLQLVRPAEDLT